MAEPRPRRAWRPLVRAWHRDLGYLLVGFTLVYALSGLAVNHVADWNPSFETYRTVHELRAPVPGDEAGASAAVLQRLRIREQPTEVKRWAPDQLDILLKNRTLHVNPESGRVVEEGQKPRLLLHAVNWLHLNRGKRAWTLVADAYAIGLLFLAISGMFMLPGKNGMRGRGGILVALGIAVPVLYVVLSGPR
ncbi:MAG TPA: PepSY-associated TM helix domain-containing protein [Armatimonadota bacterium]|nr:PepSY-associated TM helix domain-containing protein [Armatimonadota bacterium]